MHVKKDKIMIAITAVMMILLAIGFFFVSGVRGILTTSTQTSLQKISEQGANAVQTVLLSNLDSLEALSEQSALIDQTDNAAKIKILETEASRKNFLRVAYADKFGNAVTSSGQTVSVMDRAYFQKALLGQPNVSSVLTDIIDQKNKIIVYAVPVKRNQKVIGTLLAVISANDRFNIIDNVAAGSENSMYIFSNSGKVIAKGLHQENIEDFFSYISQGSSKQDVAEAQQNFNQKLSGKGAYMVNQVDKLVGYSYIKGTDGWMFTVVAEKDKIMAQANQILFMSSFLIFLLVVGFLVSSMYFFKLKKSSYESKVRSDEEMKYFTYTDMLTKLPNRNGIKKETAQWLERCRTNAQNGGALFLDVDNFQSVNNTFGHNIGDRFLTEAALRLTKMKGEKNIIGRIGGDEFALLLSDVNTADELEEYANRTLTLFQEPFMIDGNAIQLTVSIGIILFDYKQEENENEFDELINRGESILNEAKRSTKGSYALYNSEFGGIIDRQHKMENELKNSIKNHELICYFQPLYSNESKVIVGFETLARWNSPKFGIVSPLQFIEMAENTGFIRELGRFVINQTFAFAKSVQDRHLRISFNTSQKELLQADFTDYVIKCFEDYGLTTDSVAMEITESCLIESFDEVIKKLKILGEHGIVVYLDDFGTGFSSLAYLKNLPIHSVKIDKCFIDEIATDKTEKEIVDMIVLLAHRLSFEVIAEGVETNAQIECVTNCGCNITQGYYISRPVPAEEAILLLGVLPK